jgi:hypothetical protein
MKIAIIGATGQTGLEAVKQALAANHSVTALVRWAQIAAIGRQFFSLLLLVVIKQVLSLLLFADRKLSVADPDPGLGAFLTPRSGFRDGRKSASGSGMNDPDHICFFWG